MEESNNNLMGEVDFPKELFKIQDSDSDDDFGDFSSLLNQLNLQVSSADICVNELVKQTDEIKIEKEKIIDQKNVLENDRFNFEKRMTEEQQRLNDLKTEFENEKSKIFNEIQAMREKLAKEKRDFEKYRHEQTELIDNGKKALTNNYKQFEKIVNKFNSKIDGFKTSE